MRRFRESTATKHGSPPLLVKDVPPISPDQYPTAGRKKMKAPKGKKATLKAAHETQA